MSLRPRWQCLRIAAALVLACSLDACFLGGTKDPAADQARTELNALQADPQLVSRAPKELKEAQEAVVAAEESQKDPALSAHLAYIAERKVQTARALAEAHVAEDQLKLLRGE
jgi:hypothetical protein